VRVRGFVFDPRVFILPPFRDCPICSREGTYGVLMIGGTQYTRRCRECWHTDHYPLPPLEKKVIYLDQTVISHMTKALHPTAAAGREIDAFWRELVEKLDVVCKMQVAICPDTATHREESAVWTHPDALRRMYEHFSGGTSFHDTPMVREAQLMEFFENWLAGRPTDPVRADRSTLLRGPIDSWQERFRVTIGGLEPEDWPERLNESRQRASEALAQLSARWRDVRPFSFDDVYRQELRAIGQTMIQVHVQSMREAAAVMAGTRPLDPEVFMPSNATATILGIHHRLREHGVADDDLWHKTAEFFASPDIEQVPYLRISCMLFAAFARKQASGQRRPAGGGTLNDVTTIATVMPACDAMYVDNEVATLLAEEPLRTRLDFGARVFSQRTRHEFAEYLDEIRDAVSEERVAAVREVYGDSYLAVHWSVRRPRVNRRGHGTDRMSGLVLLGLYALSYIVLIRLA
jgi:hypothetical protein